MSIDYFAAIGGCHVRGHKIGLRNSFAQLTADHYSLPAGNIFLSAPTAVKRAGSLLQTVRFDPRRTFLVLQLGNFETSGSLVPWRPRSLSTEPALESAIVDPYLQVDGYRGLLEASFKLPALLFRDLIGLPAFQSSALLGHLTSLSETISTCAYKRVAVLSTFPSRHPSLSIYRARANVELKEWTQRHGYEWIDVFSLLSHRRVGLCIGTRGLFVDEDHLNANGHRLVADALIASAA